MQRPSLKSASRHSRTAPRPSKSTQEWPKSSPRAAKSAPRPPQDRPKTRLKDILKPYHIFRSYWTRKSSETFIFKWFGAFFKNPPALGPRRWRHPLSPRPPLLSYPPDQRYNVHRLKALPVIRQPSKTAPRQPQDHPKTAQEL